MQTQALYRFHIGLDKAGETWKTQQVMRLKRRHDARVILLGAYPDFSIIAATGVWEGNEEPAFIVERYGDATEKARERARDVARLLRETLEQDAIGLAILPVDAFELH